MKKPIPLCRNCSFYNHGGECLNPLVKKEFDRVGGYRPRNAFTERRKMPFLEMLLIGETNRPCGPDGRLFERI